MIRSVAGMPDRGRPTGRRPFRAPHHTARYAAMVGGGPQPAARSRDASRTTGRCSSTSSPSSTVTSLTRCASRWRTAAWRSHVPTARSGIPPRLQLVAAMNPCPCEWTTATGNRYRMAAPRVLAAVAVDRGRDIEPADKEPDDLLALRVIEARPRVARAAWPPWSASSGGGLVSRVASSIGRRAENGLLAVDARHLGGPRPARCRCRAPPSATMAAASGLEIARAVSIRCVPERAGSAPGRARGRRSARHEHVARVPSNRSMSSQTSCSSSSPLIPSPGIGPRSGPGSLRWPPQRYQIASPRLAVPRPVRPGRRWCTHDRSQEVHRRGIARAIRLRAMSSWAACHSSSDTRGSRAPTMRLSGPLPLGGRHQCSPR